MDYSAEQNQYQQYYNQYQQQQAAYDPSASSSSSQVQSYDQSAATQAYYAYNNQQYAYYPPQDYSNSYPQQTQHQYLQEPTSIHPPGVPIPHDPTHNTAAHEQTHLQNQQNAYYAQGAVENQPQQQANLGMDSGGLNPAASAAVAVLSQLTQFAGNMDAAQRAVHPQIVGQSAYRGGGRSGGRPFRGGRRGPFGNRGTRPDGSAPPYVNGRGRGGGRHFLPHGAASAPPNSVLAPAEGAAASMPPSASFPGQAPSLVPAAPSWPPPRMAWCELCRVDCNTLEILEQHKNGKRHKKNLQIQEEFKNLNKIVTGQQNVQMPNSVFKSEVVHPEKVEGSKELISQVDGSTSLAVDDNRNETEQQEDPGEKSEVSLVNSVESKRKSRDPFESWGLGPKRKMRGGRGGKYIRPNKGPRRPVEPPKHKEVIPFICELCNVKCESQVVFDSHLTGKKHLSNLKRFHGHQAIYGEAGLQALYPSNFNAPSSSSIPQVQQGISDPQVLLAQLLNYVLSQAQAPGLVPPQVPGLVVPPALAPASAPTSGPSLGARYHHISQTQESQVLSEAGSKTATTVEVENHCVSTNAQFEAPLPGNIDAKTEDVTLASKAEDVNHLQDNSSVVPAEDAEVGTD